MLARLFDEVHKAKATRQQHVMFRLADLASAAETGAALVGKVATGEDLTPEASEYLALCARINAAFVAQNALTIATEILYGTGLWSTAEADAMVKDLKINYARFALTQAGFVTDMDDLRTKV